MKYCVVIDTNVLVSSLISSHDDSATVLLIEKLLGEVIIPLYNVEILKEYSDVLSRKKFNFDSELVSKLLTAIKERGLLIDSINSDIKLIDLSDKPFYETFLTCRNDNAYLVTGNLKHFPTDEHIVSPKQMIEILNGN